MDRINATMIPAQMVDYQVLWNRANVKLIGKTMRVHEHFLALAARAQFGVTVAIMSAGPSPAAIRAADYSCLKPFAQRPGHWPMRPIRDILAALARLVPCRCLTLQLEPVLAARIVFHVSLLSSGWPRPGGVLAPAGVSLSIIAGQVPTLSIKLTAR
jgi:hypothetical protein